MVQLDPRSRTFVLLAVMLGLFLSSLDQTVVGTALPKIVTDLHGNSLYTWVVTSYLLSSTITVPIYGKFSDVFGRKLMLLIGIVLFLIGSFFSGLSQNMPELILFRGLQGLGAGALFPIALAIIGDLFTPRERGKYQGLFGGVFAVSFLIGPFIGGWITDNISWHWVFYVNLPVGIVALVVIALVLPNFHPPIPTSWRELDYLGIAVFTAAIIPLLLGLTNKVNSSGTVEPWTNMSVGGLILIGAVLLVTFLIIEARSKQPIIPLHLFKDRTFAASNAAVFLLMFGVFASIIFFPRFYQAVRGYSATDSGYTIWPLLIGLIGSSIASGFAISRLGRYKAILVGSMVVFCVGAFLTTHMTAGTSNSYLWLWMFLMGLGIGPAMSGFTIVVQNCVSPREMGVATSTMTFLRQIGGSVGLAVSGTVFSQTFSDQAKPVIISHPALGHALAKLGPSALTGVGLATQLRAHAARSLWPSITSFVNGIFSAFSSGIAQVFWLTFWSALAALTATLLVRELPLRGSVTAEDEPVSSIPSAKLVTSGQTVAAQ
jgi:EmrB/QacA subfamily drug resistance transporter